MLANIRKNMKLFSIPLWIVTASFVLTIFLVWGKGSVSGPGTNEVATVNGKAIPADEFYRLVDRLTSSGMKEKQAKSEALRQLLLRTLLLDAAEREGLKVSDEAVADKIESFPAFQKDGKFSVELYKKWLQQNHMPPEMFENQIREDLLIEKLQTIVENVASVTPTELQIYYKAVFGKRNYKYEMFNIEPSKVKVSSEEIKNYYNKHRNLFKENKVVIVAVEIPAKTKNAKELVKRAYELAKKGKLSSFNEIKPVIVKDKNLLKDINSRGGLYGYVEKPNKFIIYQKQQKSRTLSLKEARREIINLIKKEKAVKLAFSKAEKAANSGNLDKGKETGEISGKELAKRLELIDLNGEITAMIVKGKTGKVYGPFKTLKGYVVVEPITAATVKSMDKEKVKTLKEFLLGEKRKAALQSYIQFLQNKAKIQVNPRFFKGE
ncbi:SurA N-terminal domain-containing protein [Desulfurobacterium sp.]